MAVSKISGVRVSSVSCAVPVTVSTVEDFIPIFGADDVRKVSESSGVNKRHVAIDLCTSDLCLIAAEKIFERSNIEKDEIGLLVFVSQTPDYYLPATSCCLHDKLGLSKNCASFDLNLGCSGYVYGLWVTASMFLNGNFNKALLLVGDTSTKLASQEDRSVALLFGDAGSATLLERDKDSPLMTFVLGTNGAGAPNLIVPAGAFRNRWSQEACIKKDMEDGNRRSDIDLYMNGPEIFSFTLKEVPKLISNVLSETGQSTENIDAFIMHQANRFMLKHLAKRMKIPEDKLPIVLENFGNTSSASIPLALTEALGKQLQKDELDLILAGFGVGYSWAAVSLSCGPMNIPNLTIVSEKLINIKEA